LFSSTAPTIVSAKERWPDIERKVDSKLNWRPFERLKVLMVTERWKEKVIRKKEFWSEWSGLKE
jgi:hypothetical protein